MIILLYSYTPNIIDGTIFEDDYTTKIKTLGSGIKDGVGTIRLAFFQSGALLGWSEASIDGAKSTITTSAEK